MSVVDAGKRRSAGSGSKETEAETGKSASNKRAARFCAAAEQRLLADRDDEEASGDHAEVDNGKDSEPDPLTPAFLLQLIKLLKKKESLLERAKQHNDSMKDLRGRDSGGGNAAHAAASSSEAGPNQEREASLKREYAWCVVQVDRTNFQLRNALWAAAEQRLLADRDDEEASARDTLMALSRGETGGPGGGEHVRSARAGNAIVRKCDESAATLLRTVTRSAGRSSEFVGSVSIVQPLVTQCLSLLLLLRNYEEHTATAAAVHAASRARKKAKGTSASVQEREREKREQEGQLKQLELWETSFTAALEEMQSPLEGANALIFAEIVESIKTLRASISDKSIVYHG